MATPYAERDYPPIPDIRRIGVIGAGQMGAGIAHVAAQSGYEVCLSDVSRPALDAALGRIDDYGLVGDLFQVVPELISALG
jgi:predicted homoserine dehydrogenase-like protein